MRAINIWAWQENLPDIPNFERLPVCSDGSGNLADLTWHMALPFANLADLAQKLRNLELPEHIAGEPRTLQRGELQRLAIDCHGGEGVFYPNGVSRPLRVDADTWRRYRDAFRDIGLMTASRGHMARTPYAPGTAFPPAPVPYPASDIIVMACNTGATRRGSRLLQRLSHEWPGRRVIGFSVVIVFPQPSRRLSDPQSGAACIPPIALDSGHRDIPGSAADWMHEQAPQWNAPSRIPFAQATSANAKIALNGVVIQVPANEHPDGSPRHAQLMPSTGLTGPRRGNLLRPTRETESQRILA